MFKWDKLLSGRSKKKYNAGDWAGYYQPTAGQGSYPAYSPSYKRRGGRNRFFRVTAVLVILGVLFLVRQFPHPVGEQVRENLRYLLTAEWDFKPLVDKTVRLAAQMVNWDNPLLYGTPDPGLEPVSGTGLAMEGLGVPVSGKVVREYGWVQSPLDGMERFHPGIDISAPPGETVVAALAGTVKRIGRDEVLGEYILIEHGNGNYTLYGGVAEIAVEEGQEVAAGQVIAVVGEGDVPGGGLHFEVREKGELVDPLERLRVDGN